MNGVDVLEHFRDTAPILAYCSDDPKSGQWKQLREEALKHKHIQPNSTKLIRWLCFDIDRSNAAYHWEDVNACPPSLVMVNPDNGHAHYAYALNAPVACSDIARLEPLKYLAAIQEGTRRRIGADPSYASNLIKTPSHSAWYTIPINKTYSLGEMAEYCTLPSSREVKRLSEDIDYAGLGRNCTLFEVVRKQAYKDVRQFWHGGGYQSFHSHVVALSQYLNNFSIPLPQSELKSIARSVTRWIWQRFDDKQFRAIQSRKGRRKGAVKRSELLPLVLEMTEQGFTQTAISKQFDISQQTISRWLSELRD